MMDYTEQNVKTYNDIAKILYEGGHTARDAKRILAVLSARIDFMSKVGEFEPLIYEPGPEQS